jgi:hypothetical protein
MLYTFILGRDEMRVLSNEVTDGDRDLFNRDGYWISPVILDDATIEKLRTAHGRIWSKNYDGDGHPMHPFKLPADPLAIRKLDNGWWINDDVRDVVTDPSLGKMAADLLGVDGIRLWHDQIIYKPGTNGQSHECRQCWLASGLRLLEGQQ